MLHYVVTAAHRYTIDRYLQSWGRPLRRFIRPLTYEALLARHHLPRGAYVFCDVDRLTPHQAERAAQAHARAAQDAPALNHPTRVLRRYELLRALKDRGVNDFDVYRVTEGRQPGRYPVFLRTETEHRGAASALLRDAQELAAARAAWDAQGRSREYALVVEWRDTADAQGIYRKYSSFCVAGEIIPRHLFFGHDWMLKAGHLFEPEQLAEEWEYVQANPHAERLQEIFALARVDFGRVDYAVHQGRLVVWEINVNPHLGSFRDVGGAVRAPVHELFAARLGAALKALDRPLRGRVRYGKKLSSRLRRSWKAWRRERRVQAWRR